MYLESTPREAELLLTRYHDADPTHGFVTYVEPSSPADDDTDVGQLCR